MMPDFSTDDYLGIITILAFCIICLNRRRCHIWYYTILARFYGLFEQLAGTGLFFFGLWIYLIAKNACHAIARAATPWILVKFGLSDELVAEGKLDPVTEDSKEVWVFNIEMREEQILRDQELRATYRLIVAQHPDREVIDWDSFKLESRKSIGV